MGKPLVPELHDIAKLWRITDELKADLTLESQSSQDMIGLLPAKLGLPEPATNSWRGIVEHHHGPAAQASDIFLLVIADHAGSNLSRGIRRKERGGGAQLYRSVYKLWHPQDRQDLSLLTSIEDLRALIQWLATDPDRADLFSRFGAILDTRPEELQPPLNTTSLGSHLTIVGKIYHFLDQRVTREGEAWEFFGRGRTREAESAENSWPVDLVEATIGFPQQIVRTRDIGLFDLMARTIQTLSHDDRVLVATFNQLLAMLAPDEKVEDLFRPLLDVGFTVAWERARTMVGQLKATPSDLRRERASELKVGLDRIPEAHRPQVLAKWWDGMDRDYPQGMLTGPLAERFAPPICDVCQMERAITVWPPDPEEAGPKENLGPRCYALRQQASRLFKLDRWTEEPATPIAWVLINLDLDRLVGFLRPLYQKYAQEVGWSQEQVAQIDVRPPLLAEFQKDYHRFLAEFAASLEDYIGVENIEHVGGESGAAANTLLCLRLGELRRVPALLRLYLETVTRYFPVAIQERPVPFRLGISIAGVKFPFSEHWRIMQEAHDDVLVNIVGRGQIAAPLGSLPFLITAGQPENRKALHDLARVARMSQALAQVYVDDREEDHYGRYQSLLGQMRPLEMSYESLLTYAKLLED